MPHAYQIKDWARVFENNSSRQVERCAYCCTPNKQHGLSYRRLLDLDDGAAIYGCFVALCLLCSRQRKPREGWLTDDATQSGAPLAPRDIYLQTAMPVALVARTLDVCASAPISWIVSHAARSDDKQQARYTRDVAAKIVALYPRQARVEKAVDVVVALLNDGESGKHLATRTRAYAAEMKKLPRSERNYIPYPKTWFSEKRYDEDVLPITDRNRRPSQSDRERVESETLKSYVREIDNSADEFRDDVLDRARDALSIKSMKRLDAHLRELRAREKTTKRTGDRA